MNMLAQMNCGQGLLALLLIFVCGFLMIVILLQRGRGGGLAGAFGGGGGTSAFGAKTGDVFTWITVVVATIFVILAVAANFVFDQSPEQREATAAETTPVTTDETSGEETTLPIEVTPVEIPPSTPTGEAESDTGTEGAAPTPDSTTEETNPPLDTDKEQPSP